MESKVAPFASGGVTAFVLSGLFRLVAGEWVGVGGRELSSGETDEKGRLAVLIRRIQVVEA